MATESATPKLEALVSREQKIASYVASIPGVLDKKIATDRANGATEIKFSVTLPLLGQDEDRRVSEAFQKAVDAHPEVPVEVSLVTRTTDTTEEMIVRVTNTVSRARRETPAAMAALTDTTPKPSLASATGDDLSAEALAALMGTDEPAEGNAVKPALTPDSIVEPFAQLDGGPKKEKTDAKKVVDGVTMTDSASHTLQKMKDLARAAAEAERNKPKKGMFAGLFRKKN